MWFSHYHQQTRCLRQRKAQMSLTCDYDIPSTDKRLFYLQSLQYNVIDKPFLLCCLNNIFENVFTWKELRDNMSGEEKPLFTREAKLCINFHPYKFHSRQASRAWRKRTSNREDGWTTRDSKRVKAIINMPKANTKISKASPSVSSDIKFVSFFPSIQLDILALFCHGMAYKVETAKLLSSLKKDWMNEWVFRWFGNLLIRSSLLRVCSWIT